MPKYKEICEIIRNRINQNQYSSDNKLPDELTLCKEFNCSRMTMKKALDLLVLEGIIYRKRGHGSFLMESSIDNNKLNLPNGELDGLTRASKGSAKTKVIDFKLVFATSIIASKLNINETSPVYEIIRLRYINDMPYVLEKTYMDPAVIPGVTSEILSNSIYEYIENELNLKINSAKKTIRADKASKKDIEYLKIHSSDPILEVEQIAYLNNGKAFEYSFSRHRYDKFEFSSFSIRH